ncbi:hypothetical protein FQZ97_1044330 [compost metagenome]
MGQPDAAVDGLVLQLAVDRLRQHHGAGATVARGAAFLGGGEVQVLTQHLQQGAVGGHMVQRQGLAAPDKSQGLCGYFRIHACQHSAHPMAQHMLRHMARMPKQPFTRIAPGYEIRLHVRQD